MSFHDASFYGTSAVDAWEDEDSPAVNNNYPQAQGAVQYSNQDQQQPDDSGVVYLGNLLRSNDNYNADNGSGIPNSSRREESNPIPKCSCGWNTFAVLRIVKRDCEVKGKHFYSCATLGSGGCRFFQWVPIPIIEASNGGPQASTRRSGTGVCYKCNEEGHWASQCPNSATAKGGGNRQDMSEVECYRCKQKGHFANKCPNSTR
jgi:hypothetical protein